MSHTYATLEGGQDGAKALRTASHVNLVSIQMLIFSGGNRIWSPALAWRYMSGSVRQNHRINPILKYCNGIVGRGAEAGTGSKGRPVPSHPVFWREYFFCKHLHVLNFVRSDSLYVQ